MKYSVVIVTYNSRDEVFDCIRSIKLLYETEAEVIVVDNGSTDGTAKLLRSEPGILFIENAENAGFSAACNQGAQQASGECIVLLNPDTMLAGDPLGNMWRVLEENPECAAVGPVSNYAAGLQSMRNYHDEPTLSLHPNNRFAIADHLRKEFRGQSQTTPLLIGFCLMMPLRYWQQFHGLDSDLMLGMDDLDLSWRITKAGYELRVAQDAFVFHHGQRSFSKGASKTVEALKHQSRVVFTKKLVEHYGSFSSIPSSDTLWKMDWFTPVPPEQWEGEDLLTHSENNHNEQSQQSEQTHLAENSAAWCVVVEKHQSAATLRATLDHLLRCEQQEVIVVNFADFPVAEKYLEEGIDEFKMASSAKTGMVLRKVRKLYADRKLIILRAGQFFNRLQLQNILALGQGYGSLQDLQSGQTLFTDGDEKEWVPESVFREMEFPWCVLAADSGISVQTLPYLKDNAFQIEDAGLLGHVQKPDSSSQIRGINFEMTDEKGTTRIYTGAPQNPDAVPNFDLPDEYILDENDVVKLEQKFSKVQGIASESAEEESDASSCSETKPSCDSREDVPDALRPVLDRCKNVCFWGKNTTLGLDGSTMNPSTADGVVLRLAVSDLPGLSTILRGFRLQGVAHFALIYDNAHWQNPEGKPWEHSGLYMNDVRRELLRAGLVIEGYNAWKNPNDAHDESFGGHRIPAKALTDVELLHSRAESVIAYALPASAELHTDKKVSVVLLALNQVEYTRKCIESIQKNCTQNLELILVNNGSTDGTKEYFDSVPGAVVIHNEENLGVSAGWNQGIRKATGEYVLILNNDTIIVPGTIENMVRAACNHSKAGIVGPRSNQIAGPQLVKDFTWESEEEILHKAQIFQQKMDRSAWEFSRIKGFCMLVPMKVVHQVGLFDERFGKGNFEDDDYSCRVRKAGYNLLVADDSFLFHFGSVSFGQAGIDWNEQMKINMKLFEEKWSEGRASEIDDAPWDVTRATDSESEESGKFISGVSFQTSSNQSHAASGTGWEMIEQGDFEQAQNWFAQELGNDEINPQLLMGMARSLEGLQKNQDAFAFYCRALELNSADQQLAEEIVSFLVGHFDTDSISDTLSYFRRRFPHLKAFQGEENPSAMLETGWQVQVQDYLEEKDFARAMAILSARAEKGEDSFAVHNLMGVANYYQEKFDEAFRQFEQALRHNPESADALLNFYDCGLRLGHRSKVLQKLEYARSLNPDIPGVEMAIQELKAYHQRDEISPDKIIYHRECNIAAENLIREGVADKAEEILQTILQEDAKNYRALNNLGLLHWYQQNTSEAFSYFSKAVESNPWYIDALVNLHDCAMVSDRVDDFKPWLEKAMQVHPFHPELVQIQKTLEKGEIPTRLQDYFNASQKEQSNKQRIAEAQSMLEKGDYNNAVLAFHDILEKDPACVEAYNGIGISAYYRGDYEDARKLFEMALKHRPLDADTLLNYWDASCKSGNEVQARQVLENALAIDPSLTGIKEVLEA